MKRTPESILQTDGVLAVVTATSIPLPELKSAEVIGSAGDGHLTAIASQALDLFPHTDEDALRVVLGDKTISAARSRRPHDEGDGFDIVAIAVVVRTGHPVVKSLSRIIRAAMKAVRVKQTRVVSTVNEPTPSDAVPSKSWF